MSVGNLHTIGVLQGLDSTGGEDFQLSGITDLRVDPGVQEILQTAGGSVDPTYVANMSQAGTIGFTCTDVATALTNIGISGNAINSGSGSVKVFFTKYAEHGLRDATGTHFSTQVNHGLIVPRSLRASQGGAATFDGEVHASYDGTNNPFVYDATASLPSGISVDELYTVGKVDINGTDLDGITDISLDFGLQVMKVASGGDVFPTFVCIGQRSPRLTLTTKEVAALSTLSYDGVAQGATATNLYFRKIDKQGTRVADATAQHIKVTINSSQGMHFVNSSGGSNGGSADTSVTLIPISGASAIITISTASAIS